MKGWRLPFVMAAKDPPPPRLSAGNGGVATSNTVGPAAATHDPFATADTTAAAAAAASDGTAETLSALFGSTADATSAAVDAEDGDDGDDMWRFPDTTMLRYDELDVESPYVRQKLLSIRQKSCGVLAFHNGTEDALMCFVEQHARRGDPKAVLKVASPLLVYIDRTRLISSCPFRLGRRWTCLATRATG